MIKFKEYRQQEEWNFLNPMTRFVARLVADKMEEAFGEDMIVTCCWRTPEEQRELYQRCKPSQHLVGGAIDFRPLGTQDKSEQLCVWFNTMLHAEQEPYLSLVYEGNHIHLQIPHFSPRAA